MEIKIPKQDLKNIFDVMTFLTSTFPSCSESILKTAETAYNGLALEVKPLEFKRTRQQEGYYRKWCESLAIIVVLPLMKCMKSCSVQLTVALK